MAGIDGDLVDAVQVGESACSRLDPVRLTAIRLGTHPQAPGNVVDVEAYGLGSARRGRWQCERVPNLLDRHANANTSDSLDM
jgi:hypothetical protein